MQQREFTHQSQTLPYYIRGEQPGCLLLSGAHGDEYGVIDSVRKALDALGDTLSDFLYIPHVSPSSVAGGTRANYLGRDINRQFVDNTDCAEAQVVMELLKGRRFSQCISFHEDPQLSEFYMYDTSELGDDELAALRECVATCGVELFSGIDDPDDEFLGFDIVDGYRPHTGGDGEPKGPLETWLIRQGVAKRVFGIEVPGKIDPNKKDDVVKRVFECLC